MICCSMVVVAGKHRRGPFQAPASRLLELLAVLTRMSEMEGSRSSASSVSEASDFVTQAPRERTRTLKAGLSGLELQILGHKLTRR